MADSLTRAQHSATKNARTREHYSLQQKMQAVALLVSLGGMSNHSLQKVREMLGRSIPKSTLNEWLRELKPTILQADPSLQPTELDTSKIVADMREKLLRNLSSTIAKVSDRQNDDTVINAATLRDLSVTLGISVEKLLLVAGHNTHASELFKTLEQECLGTRYDPIQLLEDVIAGVRQAKQIQNNNLLESANDERR